MARAARTKADSIPRNIEDLPVRLDLGLDLASITVTATGSTRSLTLKRPTAADLVHRPPNIGQILRLLRWHRLGFAMQHQQQSNWCWSATSVSVAVCYDANTTWTQCALVNDQFGRSDCCTDGSSSNCNKAWDTTAALKRVGHLDHEAAGAAAFSAIQTEVDGGRPLCVKIVWSGGGAHSVAVVGYQILYGMVAVADPWYGDSDVAYDTFCTSYQSAGSWYLSRYTKA